MTFLNYILVRSDHSGYSENRIYTIVYNQPPLLSLHLLQCRSIGTDTSIAVSTKNNPFEITQIWSENSNIHTPMNFRDLTENKRMLSMFERKEIY